MLGLVLFLLIPMVLTLWVSFRDWSGLGSPFESEFSGLDNYRELLTEDGIRRQDFAIALRNTFYYVIIVVPAQTVLALFLAFLVNQRFLRGRGGFRTLLYFPSVTSAIAITLIWLVLFRTSGSSTASSRSRTSTGSTSRTGSSTTCSACSASTRSRRG